MSRVDPSWTTRPFGQHTSCCGGCRHVRDAKLQGGTVAWLVIAGESHRCTGQYISGQSFQQFLNRPQLERAGDHPGQIEDIADSGALKTRPKCL